jgi:hypothetical protein
MLSVTNKPFTMHVVMQTVVMLTVVMLTVVMLTVVMLTVMSPFPVDGSTAVANDRLGWKCIIVKTP